MDDALERLLGHRHTVTHTDSERHHAFAAHGALTIAVTGSTGFIGSALVASLTAGGHTVRRVVRSAPDRARGDVHWNPARGELEPAALAGVDAVIHLAGEAISDRWTPEHKRSVLESRVLGTRLIAATIARMQPPPSVLVSASAVGYYGNGGDRELDESSPSGDDFLAMVAREWEAATAPAVEGGVRVVITRSGLVLGPGGGALAKLLPVFRLGAGGKLGSGRQWMSWIALDDLVRAFQFLLFTDTLAGPVNVTAPAPVTNADFAHTLAHVLGRPALATVPATVVKLMFGEMAETMLLAGQRVLPRRLLAAGFQFRHPTLEEALRFELKR